MNAYDRMITMGYLHRCCCGAAWFDSDGHPCHKECDSCGRIVELGELEESGSCAECVLDAVYGETKVIDITGSQFNSGVSI
jgi:hypothetical protein